VHLSSPAFEDGKPIPTIYAHRGVFGGKNVSIPLLWRDVPTETKSLTLSIVDIHPVAGNWVHWIVLNIPNDVRVLGEGCSGRAMPSGVTELYNSFGELGYGGPQPPKGSGLHQYVLALCALRVGRLDLSLNSTLTAYRKAIDGQLIASARITGTYER